MKIYHLLQDSSLIKSVRKFSWNRGIPGGWLKYGPPRMVCAYGDGSLYTDDGEKYGKNYKETAWAGAIPLNQSTLVVKTKPFPKPQVSVLLPCKVYKLVYATPLLSLSLYRFFNDI